MEALGLGIAGLVATVITSGLGLYFTSKARADPLRQLLYGRQLDLVVEMISTVGRVRLLAPLIVEDSQWKQEAVNQMRPIVQRMTELQDLGAALMPADLYAELNRLSKVVTDFVDAVDHEMALADFPRDLSTQAAKTALLARSYLGVEELSKETAEMVAKGSVERASRVSCERILELAEQHVKEREGVSGETRNSR